MPTPMEGGEGSVFESDSDGRRRTVVWARGTLGFVNSLCSNSAEVDVGGSVVCLVFPAVRGTPPGDDVSAPSVGSAGAVVPPTDVPSPFELATPVADPTVGRAGRVRAGPEGARVVAMVVVAVVSATAVGRDGVEVLVLNGMAAEDEDDEVEKGKPLRVAVVLLLMVQTNSGSSSTTLLVASFLLTHCCTDGWHSTILPSPMAATRSMCTRGEVGRGAAAGTHGRRYLRRIFRILTPRRKHRGQQLTAASPASRAKLRAARRCSDFGGVGVHRPWRSPVRNPRHVNAAVPQDGIRRRKRRFGLRRQRHRLTPHGKARRGDGHCVQQRPRWQSKRQAWHQLAAGRDTESAKHRGKGTGVGDKSDGRWYPNEAGAVSPTQQTDNKAAERERPRVRKRAPPVTVVRHGADHSVLNGYACPPGWRAKVASAGLCLMRRLHGDGQAQQSTVNGPRMPRIHTHTHTQAQVVLRPAECCAVLRCALSVVSCLQRPD